MEAEEEVVREIVYACGTPVEDVSLRMESWRSQLVRQDAQWLEP